jgi:saccharopine dehydrogenase (NADP+, L-glutamate forming)
MMSPSKHILLFGAGKSATVLIDYLKTVSAEKQWKVTVADVNLAAIEAKLGIHEWVKAKQVDIENVAERKTLIASADLIIALLPPFLQYIVALDCLENGKHFLTASYTDPDIQLLANEIKQKGILFLCEMGLDPGIDHMSAMQMIHKIMAEGGKITSFRSHCGGLVAPESDDNPWHYKFSWNPRNVVMAGKAGAVYKEKSNIKTIPYEDMFDNCETVDIDGIGQLAFYPNRDSLSYIPVYALEEAETFIRTTLRYPDFCKGWNRIIALGLTDETNLINTDSLTIAGFFEQHFSQKRIVAETTDAVLNAQFEFLGLHDKSFINRGLCSAADVLQWILEKKWVLLPDDKDMIVMVHEIEYLGIRGKGKGVSRLVVKGEDNLRTAMAKTVGLPLGIAAVLILEGTITETGLHIPTLPTIYEPVLKELATHGISFQE